MSAKSKVQFFYEVPVNLEQRGRLKSFIEKIFNKEGKSLQALNYVFTTDKKLLSLNKEYLDHDYFTDILTFDLSEGSSIAGEVYISIERVRENARTLHIPFKNELLRVIIHGTLHLCGYNDNTQLKKGIMRKKEDQYMEAFG